ncbi:hypothetical protein H6F90_10355 [Trichocoleus sp. FACHB-591]|uniref:hypothetical protein n=1 Tax=Trichocoleus sp. FACHB-591 TaxID=2692872 RepID=UPI0016825D5F|nr:hypothetical protein [Trichocoleus sp. FACHB-591]MBD2095558.1 hypothetical protein [Trichocoleus sp. FACHB-591]
MARNRKQNNDSNPENLSADMELQPQPEAIAPVDEAVAGGVERLMEVIERSVENVGSDEAERELLRQGVTTVVQDTLLEFLRPQEGNMESMAMGLVQPVGESLTLGNNGTTERAIDAAVRGSQQTGMAFVEFTQGLITGTFNSIIKATLDQMKAYSDMVADLTKSLKEFASDNVSDDAVAEKLAQLTFTEKDTAGKDKAFPVVEKEPRRAYHLKRLYYMAPVTGGHRAEIIRVFGQDSVFKPTTTDVIDEAKVKELFESDFDKTDGIEVDSSKVYTSSDISTIQTAIKHGLARDGMNQLRQMAREGMARIVITEGEINTKLIFRVASTESSSTNTTNRKSQSFGGSVKAGATWGWGNASVSAYYNNLSVSTVDQTTVGNIETLTQMSGQVTLKFKTDYKPLNDGTGTVKESDLAPIV